MIASVMMSPNGPMRKTKSAGQKSQTSGPPGIVIRKTIAAMVPNKIHTIIKTGIKLLKLGEQGSNPIIACGPKFGCDDN